jgi:tetratricopeptide (TPR) repeat protein
MTRLLKAAALLALVAATIGALRWTVYLPLACEVSSTRAIDVLDAAVDGSDAVKLAAARRAESDLQGCDCFERTDFKIAYAHGIAYRYQGDTQDAIRAFRRALAADRRPEIYLALGLTQLDAIDRPAAIQSFVAAGTFAPSRLDEIPYNDIRLEVKQRVRAVYGDEWVP